MTFRQADATSYQQHDIFVSADQMMQLLLDGVLEQVAKAKVYMQRGCFRETSSHISWAVAIINSLRMSIAHSVNVKITKNATALYVIIMLWLLEANLNHNVQYLDEVALLLTKIKCAWANIAEH